MQPQKAVLIAVTLIGCSPNNQGNTLATCQQLAAGKAAMPSGYSGSVITIVMENHSRGDILGSSQAPYVNQLANQYSVAMGYHDPYVHPSLANYLWMTSGENYGVLDDDDPPAHHIASTSHIADQVETAGLTWKAYLESMGEPCGMASHGRYAAKHNPFVYFNDVNGWDGTQFHPSPRCTDHVVDYTQLDADLAAGTLANYVMISPNLDNDMHDGSIAQGDAWLAREMPKLMATPQFQSGGVIFLLWDEGSGTPTGDDPTLIAISPNAKSGMKSPADYDTSSYLKTVESLLGVDPLPCDASPSTVATMDDMFTKPMLPAAAGAAAP